MWCASLSLCFCQNIFNLIFFFSLNNITSSVTSYNSDYESTLEKEEYIYDISAILYIEIVLFKKYTYVVIYDFQFPVSISILEYGGGNMNEITNTCLDPKIQMSK